MNRRNWTDLSRKLVDRADLLYTSDGLTDALNRLFLGQHSKGIIPSALYPSPFVVSLSGSNMTGTVTAGIAWDPNGQLVEIASTEGFTLTSDGTNPRKAYLVARYAQAGDTTIAKPSNPSTNVFLNLLDSFELEVLLGTPAGSPAYPTLGANDIVLMGFTIPAGETIASNCTMDATVRDQGLDESSSVKTSNYQATAYDRFVQMNANSGALTLTLPDSRFSEGSEISVMKSDSSVNAVTVQRATGTTDTIQGGLTSFTLDNQFTVYTLKCKGGVWYVM